MRRFILIFIAKNFKSKKQLMRLTTNLFVSLVCLLLYTSCNQDYTPVGEKLFQDQTIKSLKEIVPAFTFQKKLRKVQTNGLPLAQLGKINHPVFGLAEASFAAQLNIGNNPFFGNHRQLLEDEPDESDPNLIPENERVTSVYLEIPFFTNQQDSDFDGVIDDLDVDPNDPESNSDGDELTDIFEFQAGLNPLSADSDGDGILDHNDSDNSGYQTGDTSYGIDSIYGNRAASFSLKVYELTAYLNGLDPLDNFETTQAYYSTQDYFEEGFYDRVLFDDIIQLNFEETRINFEEDDPDTLDVDESTQVETRITPRIRVPLDISFFQENLIDKEGTDDLLTIDAFQRATRGLIIRTDDFSDDLYMLLDIQNAEVKVTYEYDVYQTQGTLGDLTDDTIEVSEKDFSLIFNGIRINTLKNTLFDIAIQERITNSNNNTPVDKIYIQSGSLMGKVRLFSQENQNENELLEDLRSKPWLINEANLIFYIDPTTSSTKELLALRLYLFDYNSGAPLSDYISDGSVSNFGRNANKNVFGGLLEFDDSNLPFRYKFNITQHISNIIRNDSTNIDLGLVVNADINNLTPVKAITEFSEEDLLYPLTATLNPIGAILVGSHPDELLDDKRVRLEIIYSSY